eukprot:TRINITY_DN8554_c0_g1_i1.p1 TRINITY_DN8554_c0_g1~~TRINITY_DN8554_c0_g1_i1.p1  ORF type:complete len:506 (-),score=124.79 TRINITY_DN8554_c0_g1_i1:183-1700(-)
MVQRILLTEGIIATFIKGLHDEGEVIVKECISGIVELSEHLELYLDAFVPAIKSLIDTLTLEREDVNQRCLKCLSIFTKSQRAVAEMVNNGLVEILCNTMHNDKDVTSEQLVQSGFMLLKLVENERARQLMVKSNLLLALFPLLTHKEEIVRDYWYEAVADLSNFKEFRAQLEENLTLLKFMRKAMDDLPPNQRENLLFTVRAFVQNEKLMRAMCDKVTLTKLFELYNDVIPTAEPRTLIILFETLREISLDETARELLLKNHMILETLIIGLQKENPEISNECAQTLINLLDTVEEIDLSVIVDMPVVEAALVYKRISDPQGRAYAEELLNALSGHDEFADKVDELESQEEEILRQKAEEEEKRRLGLPSQGELRAMNSLMPPSRGVSQIGSAGRPPGAPVRTPVRTPVSETGAKAPGLTSKNNADAKPGEGKDEKKPDEEDDDESIILMYNVEDEEEKKKKERERKKKEEEERKRQEEEDNESIYLYAADPVEKPAAPAKKKQ